MTIGNRRFRERVLRFVARRLSLPGPTTGQHALEYRRADDELKALPRNADELPHLSDLDRSALHYLPDGGMSEAWEALRRQLQRYEQLSRAREGQSLESVHRQLQQFESLIRRLRQYEVPAVPLSRDQDLGLFESQDVLYLLRRAGQLESSDNLVRVQGSETEDSGNRVGPVGSSDATIDLLRPAQITAEMERLQDAIEMATSDSGFTAQPTVIYVDDEADFPAVRAAVEELLAARGERIVMASRQVRGSIFQGFVTMVRRIVTPGRVEDTVSAAVAGGKSFLSQQTVQNTKTSAEAAATVLTAMGNSDNGLAMLGDLLVLKVNGTPFVRQLTPEQVEHLMKNPALFGEPAQVLHVLNSTTMRHPFYGKEEGEGPRAVAP